ncbi:MAG: transporter substrate-binding domain-containing protein [Rhodospirillaceae bacterium]|jgi:polar amino acid transport system substrate-binding protein|nr:transporter substrate-binding domain-containing protein [Rhodospirillaceae bacterium]
MNKGILAIIAIVVLAVIGYFVFKPAPQPETPVAETTAPAPAPEPAPAAEATTQQPAATQEAAVAPGKVRFGVAAEPYPPFSSKDATGTWVGFEMDLMKAVCESQKMDCELVEVAWDGIIPALTEKKIDVIWSSMSITDERKKVIDFTNMYYDSANTMIGRADDSTKIDMNAPDSMKGKVIGVQTSTIHANFIEKYFGAVAEVKLYDTLDNALADLAAGRLDYVSESATSLAPFLEANKDFATKIAWPLDPIFGAGVGGGVRKEDTALKEQLNAGIADVVKSGKYDEMLKAYPGLGDQIQKPAI